MKPNTLYIVRTDENTTDTEDNFEVVNELVPCKDCIHRNKDGWCEILGAESPIDEGFCCYGDRRTE